jgi:hypothetical protein
MMTRRMMYEEAVVAYVVSCSGVRMKELRKTMKTLSQDIRFFSDIRTGFIPNGTERSSLSFRNILFSENHFTKLFYGHGNFQICRDL